ncbi:hypothetical protein ACIG5E_11650 [Kitasatospora sp. NPDC053057]|uniref:hypothetical protein n=1 Tax=Kitasatospora sp. NPDC053057 TaxID=3364062 RepID=UPI0037C97EC9
MAVDTGGSEPRDHAVRCHRALVLVPKFTIAQQRDQDRVIEATPTGNPVLETLFDGSPRQLWDINPS